MCGAELHSLPEGVQRVARALQERGHPHMPQMLGDAARTAQQAADALGISLGQIAKSIIFRRKSDEAAVLVITSGDRRVDERKVDALVGKTGRADADFVRARTGFAIGGVSPVGHLQPPVTLIDRDLFRFDEIWAAAGHPHGVFRLRPQDLPALTGGAPVADIAQAPAPDTPVPSPCVSVCQMDAASGLCTGCLRTLDEIAAWASLGDEAKREVWARLKARAGAARSDSPGTDDRSA